MKTIFPEIESIPHADTLADLLEEMEVDRLEDITVSLIRELMRSKKFIRSLQDKRYIVAMDGSGKYSRDWQFSTECLHRKKPDGSEKYFVYVLEAALILGNGMSLPFMSEFLDNGEYDFSDKDKKQDCYTNIHFIPMFWRHDFVDLEIYWFLNHSFTQNIGIKLYSCYNIFARADPDKYCEVVAIWKLML